MSAWFTAEMGRFAMTEGEIQWNRKEIFSVETNEYAVVEKK